MVLLSPSGTRLPENIYIGSKPVLNYVTALVTAFQKDPIVNVMARGRAISSAVDVVEVCKRSFVTDINIDDILIGTEKMGDGDDLRNVSTIQIVLKKPT
jgi:DNA-binding protein Alba